MNDLSRLIDYVQGVVDYIEPRSQRVDGGLIWCSGRFNNRLTLSRPRMSGFPGVPPTEVRVLGSVTPFVRSVSKPQAAVDVSNAMNSNACMSAVVWNPITRELLLSTALSMHPGNLPNIQVWDSAFYLQAFQAERFADDVAERVGGESAVAAESEWTSEPSHLFKEIGESDLSNYLPFDGLMESEFAQVASQYVSAGLDVHAHEEGVWVSGQVSRLVHFDFPGTRRHLTMGDDSDFQLLAGLEGRSRHSPPLGLKGARSYLDIETVEWTGAGLGIEILLPAMSGVGADTAIEINRIELDGHRRQVAAYTPSQLGGWYFDDRLGRLGHRLLVPSWVVDGSNTTVHTRNFMSGEFGRFRIVFSLIEGILGARPKLRLFPE